MGRFPAALSGVPLACLLLVTLLAPAGSALADSGTSSSTPVPEARPGTLIGFGTALVLDGDDLIVGRPATAAGFPMPPSESGSVHVFELQGAEWSERAVLRSSEGQIGDAFGQALSLDGDWLAVGAPFSDGSRGAVHLFERSGPGWSEVTRLQPANLPPGAAFGSALALRGDVLMASTVDGEEPGVVVVFRRTGDGWTEETRLRQSPSAGFGRALAFDGEEVWVGAPGTGTGAVFAFRSEGGGRWTASGTLRPDGEDSSGFGAALLLGPDGLFVGSPESAGGQGAVHPFRRGTGEWEALPVLRGEAPGEAFGSALARAGDDLLVGAPMASGGAGSVVVARRTGDDWRSVQTLSSDALGMGVQFGAALVAASARMVVGGPGAAFFEGVGFEYGRSASGTWEARAEVIPAVEGLTALTALTGEEIRCDGGTAALFACNQIDVLSFIPVQDLGADRGIMLNDMWGWTHEESGREFALVGRLDGTVFIEVTDPANPVFLGELPLHEGARPNMWRDIKVYADHAYIVSDGAGPHGMQVLDLTQLLTVTGPPQTFEETAHYDRIASAHNIVINEDTGFAYAVGSSMGGETCGGALHMIDIREPANPTFAGCFGDPATGFASTGYTHDAQCVTYRGPDEDYQGREICFNASENAVGIADVTDKDNPVPLGNASYPNVAYAHQGWLTEDHRYFFVNDEGDELSGTVPMTRTLIFDVQDLEDPVMAREFLGTTPASDHNLYIRGNLMYQSHYVAGLRVVDISDPLNPVEVGHLETIPTGEVAPGFAGSWSNYPYFRSGAVGVTSMREGFFMVRFRPLIP